MFHIKLASISLICSSPLSRAIQGPELRRSEADSVLDSFIKHHNRSYKFGGEEYELRRAHFSKHRANVEQHNMKEDRLWTASVNKFADRTPDELAKMHGYNRLLKTAKSTTAYTNLRRDVNLGAELPEEKSHDKLIATQPSEVLDQGNCGSCWAAATAVMMRAHSELHGTYKKYSVQELVSCTPNPSHCGGTGGCDGATGELALEYIKNNGLGLETEFPYKGVDLACPKEFSQRTSTVGMKSWETLESNKAEPLKRALVEKGPVAVGVAAVSEWFYYSTGIFDSCSVDEPVLNHLVVLIGYGKSDGKKHWQIQNSWGREWGENGHMKILMSDNEDEKCGWDTKPEEGVACENDTDKKVWVCGTCGILYDNVVPSFV